MYAIYHPFFSTILIRCEHQKDIGLAPWKVFNSTAKLTNVKPFIPVLMTLCLQSCYHIAAFEMSEYVADTPQARYKHVTGVLHTLNVWLMHAWGTLQTHSTNVRPKALWNRNVQVAYTTSNWAECIRNVFDALVTQVKLICMGHTPELLKIFYACLNFLEPKHTLAYSNLTSSICNTWVRSQ